MELDLGQWIVIGVSAALIGGYIGGYYYNRRQAERAIAWLRAGLGQFGEVGAGERMGGMTTGGRLVVGQAGGPFRRVEAIFILEARENLIFWLFNRLRGKRDELFLKIHLRSAPEQAVETARRGDAELHRLVKEAEEKPYTVTSGPRRMEIARRGGDGVSGVEAFLERYGHAVTRLSLKHESPHLVLRASLSALQKTPAVDFFAALKEMVKQTAARPCA